MADRKVKYLLVGIWNSAFGVSSFVIMTHLLSPDRHQLALLLSYVISIMQSHASQRKLVWASAAPYFKELYRFAQAYLSIYVVNAITLWVAVDSLNFNVVFSQMALALFFASSSYIVNKRVVFTLGRSER